MPTRTLGRYRIERELGRGSMGHVFLAYDPEIQRRVAIKTISIFSSLPESERADARARFLREIRAAGKLLHPGIITVFDVGEERGLPYLAMEYVEGHTLDQFCKQDRLLHVKTVVEAVARAAEALDFAHASGVVHRDIKPANILRTSDTTIKIMDFGLAKGPHASMTQDGALLGTPAYMSPEQIRGEVVDGRSDLFSLGVVLYEMLTGEKPFAGESVSSVLYRIVHDEPRNASMVHARVPPSLAAFLDRAMAKDVDDRFQTGEEFARGLREAGSRLEGKEGILDPSPAEIANPVPVPEASIPPPPTRKRSSLVPWIALAALVIGAAAAVYALRLHEQWFPWLAPPPPQWLEAEVRTEPPGLPVLFNGEPIEGSRVRFPVESPHGVLTTTQECRTAEYSLDASDAGTEIALVTDPVQMEVNIDPGVVGAAIRLNGAEAGAAPTGILLNLCRDNQLDVQAAGYTAASLALPPGATVAEARSAVAALVLEKIPLGRLVLPALRTPVQFFVNGEVTERTDEGIELPAGEHTIRAVSRRFWVDVTAKTEVPAGETVTATFQLPPMSVLIVQAFPSNCKVYLRRPRGRWVFLDTTPVRTRIAAGSYEVRVEFIPTGEIQEKSVTLDPGEPVPIRFSFARS